MTRIQSFFDNTTYRYQTAVIKTFTVQGKPVKCFHAFQSLNDLRNDLQAIFIKPLINFYLSNVCALQLALELYLTAIHALTLSSECFDHLTDAIYVGIFSVISYCLIIGELLMQSLSFLLRLAITGTTALKKLAFVPTEEIEPSVVLAV